MIGGFEFKRPLVGTIRLADALHPISEECEMQPVSRKREDGIMEAVGFVCDIDLTIGRTQGLVTLIIQTPDLKMGDLRLCSIARKFP
jgi:hypothetical protein